MNILRHKKNVLLTVVVLLSFFIIVLNSCITSQKITAKSGTLLWAENCQRCHNTPPPNTFSQEQWETIGLHMQSRALLTETEKDKIITFLKQ